ncbi:MAG: hypothetical protein IKN63_04475 [Bacilli bacterium]|nr:hypothetical protein [Bacilli bacterium]
MNGNNQYLIPANTKKGGLILNIFMPIDLWIFGIGVGSTLLILILMSTLNHLDNLTSIVALVPGLVAVVLVFPFPNYHNIRTAIGEVIAFYTNRQRYVWRGWCSSYELKDK